MSYLLTHPDYIFSRASALDKLRMKESVYAESILKADVENFEIQYSDITVTDVSAPGKGSPFEFRVFIGDLNVPKYKFYIRLMYRYLDDFMELLRIALPGKI